MPRPKSRNVAKVHTVWYSYKGVWLDEDDAEEQSKRKPIVKDRKVPVDIYVHKTTNDSDANKPPYPIKSIEFEMRCEEVKPDKSHALSITGPNIETIREAIWGELDGHFAVEWHDYLIVEVETRRPYSCDDGLSVEVKWRDVHKGIAHDGALLLREMKAGYNYHGGYGYKVTPWPGEFKDEHDRVVACIPDNAQNKQSLEEFKKRFEEVGKAFRVMLEPKQIVKTLAGLSAMKQLPFGPVEHSAPAL